MFQKLDYSFFGTMFTKIWWCNEFELLIFPLNPIHNVVAINFGNVWIQQKVLLIYFWKWNLWILINNKSSVLTMNIDGFSNRFITLIGLITSSIRNIVWHKPFDFCFQKTDDIGAILFDGTGWVHYIKSVLVFVFYKILHHTNIFLDT